jgi:TatD DNase family protein
MIDFHTHLDLYSDAISVACEASAKNKFTLAVTTSPRAWIATSRVLGALPRVKIALGLHPEIAAEKATELDLFLESVSKADFIGETGLDGSTRHRASFAVQVTIFEALLKECTAQGGRIISIHSRGAVGQVLDLLDRNPDAGIPVMHWFTGTKAELARAIKQGCWFSFGPAGTLSKSGRDILELIPLERLLPESDGPFGKIDYTPLMPWQANSIIPAIVALRGIDREYLDNQFDFNLREILRLVGLDHD